MRNITAYFDYPHLLVPDQLYELTVPAAGYVLVAKFKELRSMATVAAFTLSGDAGELALKCGPDDHVWYARTLANGA